MVIGVIIYIYIIDMKTLNEYKYKGIYNGIFKNLGAELVVVKTKNELSKLIEKTMKEKGPNCDLNFIDVSKITDMSDLFVKSDFNGDISGWDVSNVKSMRSMFEDSTFNGDISGWDISNVKDMSDMFAKSKLEKLNKLPGWYHKNEKFAN